MIKVKENLQEKQKKLIESLSQVGPFIEGSLSTVARPCGNPNCQCRKDPAKKHPSTYLTWKENKKTKALYIPVAHLEDAELWNANYKKLKKQIRKVSDFHKKLLRAK
jgi:curved DNA-binding protein CbpA